MTEQSKPRLLILYGSQTGNAQVRRQFVLCCPLHTDGTDHLALDVWTRSLIVSPWLQDVAERVAREASLMLYAPSIMPMDGYPLQQLPEERYVVFVTSTTGQVDLWSTGVEAADPHSVGCW